jgi:uncharacterized peroxidase-related enzyme
MPFIKPVDRQSTDKQTVKTLNAVERKLGTLPNIFTTFAHSPAALKSYLQLTETLAKGRLSARQREMLAIAVAEENTCEYCLSAHIAIGTNCGLSEQDIILARQGSAADSLDRAITRFAVQVTRSKATLNEVELNGIKRSGLDDELVVEVIANVAMNTMTNYLNRIAGTDVDFPLVKPAVAA